MVSYDAIAASGTDLADQAMGILEDALSDGTLEAIFRLWYGDLPFSLDDLALDGVTFEQEAPESEETPASEGESGGRFGRSSEREHNFPTCVFIQLGYNSCTSTIPG